MMKIRILALLFCGIFTTAIQAQIDRSTMPESGELPEINLGEPDRYSFNNGIELLVVEDHKLPQVTARLVIDNDPIYEEKPGTASLLSSMLGTGTENMSKDEFNEEVDFLGANVNFGSQSAYASSLKRYFPRIMELMADGALNPKFTEENFKAEKDKLIENIKSSQNSASAIASRVSSALAYGKNHPFGQVTSVESVKDITLDDVKNMYRNYFVPENAYMVVVGDIKKRKAKRLVKKHFKKWKSETPPSETLSEPKNAQFTQVNLVDMPNAVQSEVYVQNTVDLQMNDEDYFPVLVANQILGGSFGSYLNMNLREDKGYTYGARSNIGASQYASRFYATASVRNAVTDSAVVEFLKEIDHIRDSIVDPQKLEDVKSKFAGNFVMNLEDKSTIANYALNIETNDLPEDFYKNYLKEINAVTADDVQRVAQKYIKPGHLRIVIAGKGADIASPLEKMTYKGKTVPVKYYNKKAEEVEKPVFSKEIPDGVTVETVYDQYIEAIGGREAVEDINSMMTKGNASVQGMTLNMTMKQTADGKSFTEVTMGGNVVNKTVFNGESGYRVMRGQKMEMSDEQIEAQKKSGGLFPELEVGEDDKLTAIVPVDGEDAYVVQKGEDTKLYYAVDSGLKIMEETTAKQGGQEITTKSKIKEYKEMNGIKVPMKINREYGPQTIKMEMTEVKFNEGVSASDFE